MKARKSHICLNTIKRMCKDDNCICIAINKITKIELDMLKENIEEEFPTRVVKKKMKRIYIFKREITRLQRILYYILYSIIIKK